MASTLTFEERHEYGDLKGITLPVILKANGKEVRFPATLDTGAQNCIFNREYGEGIGLSIEDGKLKVFGTATGPFNTYGHWITLSTLGHDFEIMAYFSQGKEFPRNVLGREDWLLRVGVGIVHYKRHLYLSHYDDLSRH